METIIRAIEDRDVPAFWSYLNQNDTLDHLVSGSSHTICYKTLRVLVDVPLRLPVVGVEEYHRALVKKFGDAKLKAQVLRMLKRSTAGECIMAVGSVDELVALVGCFDSECDASLFYACLNSLRQFDSLVIHKALSGLCVDSVIVQQLIDVGSVDIKVVQVLALLAHSHSTTLLDRFMAFWTDGAELDGPLQVYNTLILLAILGDTAAIGIGSGVNVMVLEGVQRRLEQCGVANEIGKVVGELVLSTGEHRLDFKCDYELAVPKALYEAYYLGRSIRDRLCLELGLSSVASAYAYHSSILKQKDKPVDDTHGEPMAKNDKNRVRAYLSDSLVALNDHDNNQRRLEAINTLLLLLPNINETELSDHRPALIQKLLSNLTSIALIDRNDVLQLRAVAILRMPEEMTRAVVECLFKPASIGLAEKIDVMTGLVRACQHALGGKVDDSLEILAGLQLKCPPEKIAVHFVTGCLDYVPKRGKLVHFQSGWFGERLLLAMATMLPAIPPHLIPSILGRLSETMVGLTAAGKCPKAVKRGAMVLLLAASEVGRRAGVVESAQFIVGCGTVIEGCLHGGGGDGEEIRGLALNLAGALREAFPVERVLLDLMNGSLFDAGHVDDIVIAPPF